jgi:large subunit ribosomal protein L10
MNRGTKAEVVDELRGLIVGKQSVILTDYKGMTVAEMFDLRRKFDAEGVGFRVVKNTLCKLAIAGTDYEFLGEGLEGTVAVAFSEDPVAPAKVLSGFMKETKHLQLKLGYLDGKRLEVSDIDALAKLPSKDALRGQLLSTFNAPAQKFVGVLAAAPRDFVGVLSARAEKLG